MARSRGQGLHRQFLVTTLNCQVLVLAADWTGEPKIQLCTAFEGTFGQGRTETLPILHFKVLCIWGGGQ